MTSDKPVRDKNVDSAIIPALSSIKIEQAEIIVQAIGATGPGWDVQTMDDYDGYLSILISPNISGNKHTSFFVAGTAQNLELFKAFEDDMTSVASFRDVEGLLVLLLDLIAEQ